MRRDKTKVLRLRKLGKSYNEIRRQIRIPKSTLSEWLGKIRWSKRIKNVLIEKSKERSAIHLHKLDKIRGERLAKIYREGDREARREFRHFKLHPLFIAGLSIYWGEGDRSTRNIIRVANTDPLMIKLFIKFLRQVCGVPQEKIRASLLLYPDLNPKECRKFWMKYAGLRSESFTKDIVIQGRHKTKRLRHGVCTANTCSTYLKQKILLWLTLLPKEIDRGMYYPRP